MLPPAPLVQDMAASQINTVHAPCLLAALETVVLRHLDSTIPNAACISSLVNHTKLNGPKWVVDGQPGPNTTGVTEQTTKNVYFFNSKGGRGAFSQLWQKMYPLGIHNSQPVHYLDVGGKCTGWELLILILCI